MSQAAMPLVPPLQVRNPIPPPMADAEPEFSAPVVPGSATDGAEYQELKDLDAALDSAQDTLSHAQELYQETLKKFAFLCHELWEREKAQGNHHGKGFRQKLQALRIKAGRAYRVMKKFFPSDFSSKRKSLAKNKFSALSAADKVLSEGNQIGLRFAGKLPEGKEALECIFALTPEEKAEFAESLQLLDAAQVQRLFLQALKQAAQRPVTGYNPSQVAGQKSEIINNDAVCSGIAQNGASAVCPHPNTQKSEIINQKSEIPQKLEAQKSEIINNDAICNGIAQNDASAACPQPNTQKS